MRVKPVLCVIGISQASAPLSVRERFAYSDESRVEALAALRERCSEAVILDTCNRSEIYAVAPGADLQAVLSDFLVAYHGVERSVLQPHTYVLAGRMAVFHLLAVASGIDSQLIGESQILSQVRGALAFATRERTRGSILSALFRQALRAGKRAQSETAIGRGALSLGSLAVQKAQTILGSLRGRSALVIGSGAIGTLTAHALRAAGAQTLWIAGRTPAHVETVAAEVGAMPIALDHVADVLPHVAALFSATAAAHPVVSSEMVARARTGRTEPLCIVDLALPRDVDPTVASLPNVTLIDLDGLLDSASENLSRRQAEVRKVEAIVNEETDTFMRWLHTLSVAPEIAALHHRAERIRQHELNDHRGRLKGLSAQEWKAVESMTASIIGQLLYDPTLRLKERAGNGDGASYAAMLRELFALDESHEV